MKRLLFVVLSIAAFSAQVFSQTNLAIGATITSRYGLGDPNLAIDNDTITYWFSNQIPPWSSDSTFFGDGFGLDLGEAHANDTIIKIRLRFKAGYIPFDFFVWVGTDDPGEYCSIQLIDGPVYEFTCNTIHSRYVEFEFESNNPIGVEEIEIYSQVAQITVSLTYDEMGNRVERNVVTLKSAQAYASELTQTGDVRKETGSEQKDVFEENVGDQKVTIYPNPTRGALYVEIAGYQDDSKNAFYVYSLSGKLLLTKTGIQSSFPIDMTMCPKGTYILKVVLGNKVSNWKIIKE